MRSGWYWLQQPDLSWCVARYRGDSERGYFQLCGSAEMVVLADLPQRGIRLGERIEEPRP